MSGGFGEQERAEEEERTNDGLNEKWEAEGHVGVDKGAEVVDPLKIGQAREVRLGTLKDLKRLQAPA